MNLLPDAKVNRLHTLVNAAVGRVGIWSVSQVTG